MRIPCSFGDSRDFTAIKSEKTPEVLRSKVSNELGVIDPWDALQIAARKAKSESEGTNQERRFEHAENALGGKKKRMVANDVVGTPIFHTIGPETQCGPCGSGIGSGKVRKREGLPRAH